MKLTQANVAKVVPDRGKYEGRVFDNELIGFGVRVWGDPKSLKRAWIIQWRRLNGKTQTLTLGRCDRMAASVARELAKEKLAHRSGKAETITAETGISCSRSTPKSRSALPARLYTPGRDYLLLRENNAPAREALDEPARYRCVMACNTL